MAYRSMKKTDSDKMKTIDEKNPENKQVQSVLSNAYNESAVEFPQKNNAENLKPGMRWNRSQRSEVRYKMLDKI